MPKKGKNTFYTVKNNKTYFAYISGTVRDIAAELSSAC